MLRIKAIMSSALALLALTACGDDSTASLTEEDERQLDEVAKQLDEEMPEARAEKIKNAEK